MSMFAGWCYLCDTVICRSVFSGPLSAWPNAVRVRKTGGLGRRHWCRPAMAVVSAMRTEFAKKLFLSETRLDLSTLFLLSSARPGLV